MRDFLRLLGFTQRSLSNLLAPPRFDMKLAAPFIQKSLSENTKAAYRRVIKEFFAFAGERHPSLEPVMNFEKKPLLSIHYSYSQTYHFYLGCVHKF